MPKLLWVKSSYSDAGGNNCVEVAGVGRRISLRESESPDDVITADPAAFGALVAGIKSGRLPS